MAEQNVVATQQGTQLSVAAQVKSMISQDAVKKKFTEVLGQKAPQFLASITNVVAGSAQLKKCPATTIMSAAFVAATYDLPIDSNLGFAAIVPYNNNKYNPQTRQWEKHPEAQFQMMYKGFIQLAIRSGYYEKMNCSVVYKDELVSYNPITGEVEFTVYGYFSQLTKALKKATRWSKSTLGLDVKPAWQIYHISSFEEEKEFHRMRQGGSHKRTQGVDMMGFVVRRTYTIIRSRVFKRIRRQFLRAAVDLERLGYIPWWRACRIMAYKGWTKYSNSQGCSIKYNMQNLFKIAAQSVSRYGRKEYVKYEQRMLLIAAA